MPRLIRVIGHDSTGPFPNAALAFLALALVTGVLLNATTFGRLLVAAGANRAAARASGVNVNRVTTYAYMLCGFLAACAGLVLAGYVGYADQWIGQGYDLDAIAAAVVGGTSFAGGEGGILGTVAGVLLVAVLLNLVVLLNLDVEIQMVVKGVVLILAVALYSVWRRK
jgi:ribose/xylose/arabinose/galactoside ABC-type transport system permease subunit